MNIKELSKAWNAQRKANRDFIDGNDSATVKAATDFLRDFLEG